MKTIYKLFVILLLITACEDLDQVPPNFAKSDTLSDYETVLYAAYGYHFDAVAPMAVFGDFRSDNALFDETPFTDFDEFGTNALTSSMTNDFFRPFYAALYKSILSTNIVIENSTNDSQVGEAKFIRALSYFKLVQVFGDVTVNLSDEPDNTDTSLLTRKSASSVYSDIIIPDLRDAIGVLSTSGAKDANGRATSIAAQGLLGKVYATIGNYSAAATELKAVIDLAETFNNEKIGLATNFADIFASANDLNSEILFATQISSTAQVSTYGGEIFTNWYAGKNTKADDGAPMSQDLIDAFAASIGDARTALTLDANNSVKFGADNNADWIELRLTDVIMLYAEALNENGSSAEDVLDLLDPIRMRAGLTPLDHTVLNTEDLVRQAILDERRLEFACEGQRWFDLIRFDAAQPGILNAEMGETINSNYHIFPIPNTEVTSFDEIVQNSGY